MRAILVIAIGCIALSAWAGAQNTQPQRPRITSIDHAVFYTTAPEEARKLFTVTLGLPAGTPTEPGEKWRYVVGRQWVGYMSLANPKDNNRWDHQAFTTDSVDGMKKYLEAKGYKTSEIVTRSDKSKVLSLTDPEGYKIEFVERPKSEAVPAPPPQPASLRLMHTGLLVKDRAAMDKFYRDTLGFRVYWYGGKSREDHPAKPDWLSMQVPDGTDWFEYMMNIENPDLKTMGIMNHISLGVKDMNKAEAVLRAHGWTPNADEKQQDGTDGKKQLNVFDKDWNRVELMEFTNFTKPCCSEFQGKHPSENDPL